MKEYVDLWKSIFDVVKPIAKKYFILFAAINFLCVLIIYQIAEFSENKNLIITITNFFFFLTFMFGAIKSKIPKITRKIFGRILLAAILIGFLNALQVFGNIDIDNQGYGIVLIMLVCIIVYPIFVTISILIFNVFKKDQISNLELVIYFVILLCITMMVTQLNIDDFSG